MHLKLSLLGYRQFKGTFDATELDFILDCVKLTTKKRKKSNNSQTLKKNLIIKFKISNKVNRKGFKIITLPFVDYRVWKRSHCGPHNAFFTMFNEICEALIAKNIVRI